MAAVRRTLTLLGLLLGLVVAGSLPAWASFVSTKALPTMSVSSLTVAPATQVRVEVSCILTTTRTEVVRTTDPATGATTSTLTTSTSSSQSTTTNVDSYNSTTTPGPGAN